MLGGGLKFDVVIKYNKEKLENLLGMYNDQLHSVHLYLLGVFHVYVSNLVINRGTFWSHISWPSVGGNIQFDGRI